MYADPDGTVTLGYAHNQLSGVFMSSELVLRRVTAAGTPDSRFGVGGTTTFAFGTDPLILGVNGVALMPRPGGGLLIAYQNGYFHEWGSTLLAVNNSGAVDTSWGNEWWCFGTGYARSAATDGDAVVAVMEEHTIGPFFTLLGYAALRVTATGAPSRSRFGPNGRRPITEFEPSAALATRDGATYVGGPGFTVLKLQADGSVDPSFGVDGIASASTACPARARILTESTGFYLVGFSGGTNCETRLELARFGRQRALGSVVRGGRPASFAGVDSRHIVVGGGATLQSAGRIEVGVGIADEAGTSPAAAVIGLRYRTVGPTMPLSLRVEGHGTVSLAPYGLTCRADCQLPFNTSSTVTLRAVADLPGWRFSGWSGDCAGQSQAVHAPVGRTPCGPRGVLPGRHHAAGHDPTGALAARRSPAVQRRPGRHTPRRRLDCDRCRRPT